jgi:hypothetical protein
MDGIGLARLNAAPVSTVQGIPSSIEDRFFRKKDVQAMNRIARRTGSLWLQQRWC